ncbi:unnamed protein product [Pelagomonas calceolata]|uniref:Coiled-coil domain-containing protein 40 n=1 Tax=Pelagomonas calceolata TaxID=35677 RepID=A0A8J2STC7_9STRA|nr:unnamed protein product [Pelagomonas calceolata]|mmetsp:Transcript_22373/g.66913  ORF Transcript_22373/g.66913 Transcript_22373/m.66913 type:complete len:931 (+) Transcript_22373:159-2951(+)
MADDAGDTPGADPAVTSVPPAQTMAAAPAPAGFGERPATRGDTPAANSDAADIPDEAEQQLVADMVNNPMLDKVQKILVETLLREQQRTANEARELAEMAQRASRKREDTGVELYGAQQQLARLQLSLEQIHANAAELAEQRAHEETAAQEARARHGSLNKALSDRRKHVAKNQAELDAINDTLRQVETYNEEMQKEIAVTKRATYKAEEQVQSLEKAKEGQDLYVNKLDERARVLGERIAVTEARLAKQQDESAEARKLLAETGQEMDLVAFEKKQLLQQWKSSLVQLARRDEALAAAQTQLEAAREVIRDVENEIIGTRREENKQITANRSLEELSGKIGLQEAQCVEETQKYTAEADAVAAQFDLLHAAMTQVDEEEKKIAEEGKHTKDGLGQLSANIQIVTVERQKIEQKVLSAASDRATINNAIEALKKPLKAVKQRTQDLEMQQVMVDNELARVKIDALNTKAHNDQLKETLASFDVKLKEQEDLIGKYQREIRQRHDDVEKKTLRVAFLNRKLQLHLKDIDLGPEEAMGPLENEIRMLRKETSKIKEECSRLQGVWLADQTRLVEVAQRTEAILEETAELRARNRILDERRIRITKEGTEKRAAVAALHKATAGMRADTARLNELIGKHTKQQEALSNETGVLELSFRAELKELETESLAAEQKVHEARSRKNVLLEEVIDGERQVLLWEKKIELERETQAALDPSVGTGEIKAMEIEIHRMKMRLEGLQREQEAMIKEMERGIAKREAITLRYKGKARPTALEHTKQSLREHVKKLRGKIQATAREASQLSNAITNKKQELDTSTSELADATARYGSLETDANDLQQAINRLLYEKQRRAELQAAKEATVGRYLDLERGTAELRGPEHASEVDAALSRGAENLGRCRDVIAALGKRFDYLAEPLGRIKHLADDAEAGQLVAT